MLADVLETRVRKEKELEYYQKELEKLQEKMFFIKKDIDITNLIIDMIEKENVIDIRQHMLEKKDDWEARAISWLGITQIAWDEG